MRITPDSPGKTTHITLCQIHTANKPDASVNHHYLTVITIVHFTGKQREAHFQKATHLYSCLTHLFVKAVRNMPTAHIIVNNTYFYSLPCLIYQHIAHHTSDSIILKNIELHMNMLRSIL